MLIASWLRSFGLTRGIADPVFHQSWTDGSWGSRKGRESRSFFCKELVAKHRCMRGLLSNLAQHLKSKFDNGVFSCTGRYKNTLSQIARIDREAVKGAQVCSRVQWVEEG